MTPSSSKVKQAVSSIAQQVKCGLNSCEGAISENSILQELCLCVLGSQVRYEVALTATERLVDRGALRRASSYAETVCHLEDALREPLIVDGKREVFRFPRAKAFQLAGAWQVLGRHDSLRELLDFITCPFELRRWLVSNVPGLGPKQASMFLRNCGKSYDLAVIDRHVVYYMSIVGLCKPAQSSLSRLSAYCGYEEVLRRHAREFECPVGVLDWAIWIVVRAARSMEGSKVALQ